MTVEMNKPNPDPRATTRMVNSMLAQLKIKPDTGVIQLLQVFRNQPVPVQDIFVQTLAEHYRKSDIENLRRLEQEIKSLKQPPLKIAILESFRNDEMGNRIALVTSGNDMLEVAVSIDVQADELIPGTRVVLPQGNSAIIGSRGFAPACAAAELERILTDGRFLLSIGNEKLVVQRGGEFLNSKEMQKLKPGDLIEYEPSIRHALRVALNSVKTAEFVGEVPDISWEDIGGLNEVRETVETEVFGPLLNPKVYESYGVKPPHGILFEGPPGCGKTMLIKALGKSLVSALRLDQHAPVLFQIKGSSLLSSYVGESGARVRALGAAAREAAKEYGLAIIMLDDFEYGGGLHRGIGDRSSPAYSNLTASLISEMEGLGNNGKIVWAATANRADLIDSALLRSGRFSKKINVGRPNPQACIQILLVHLKGKPIAPGYTSEELAEKIVEQLFTYDDEHLLLRIHFADGAQYEVFPSQIISGAIMAETCRCAGLRAICRDLSKQFENPSGITFEDLSAELDQQLQAATSFIEADNASLHYLGIPAHRRVVAVEHVFGNRQELLEK
jgi:proteasome-associated ATPase